jgi:hypothetical protein
LPVAALQKTCFMGNNLGVNFTNIFGANLEQLLHRQFLIRLVATALGKNMPRYGARHKSCSLKYAAKFQQKCWKTKHNLLRHLLHASTFAH